HRKARQRIVRIKLHVREHHFHVLVAFTAQFPAVSGNSTSASELVLQVKIYPPSLASVVGAFHVRFVQKVDDVGSIGVHKEPACLGYADPRHQPLPVRHTVSPLPEFALCISAHVEHSPVWPPDACTIPKSEVGNAGPC